MNKLVKILFIGNFNKESDVKAFKLLNSKIYSITKFDTRYRKEKLPKRISQWKGDYIFHLFSYIKLPKKLINNAKIAAINFHPSLPKYPGSGGLTWTLMNNDLYFGVTVHFMNFKIDNGKIIKVFKSKVDNDDNIVSLIQKADNIKLQAFKFVLKKINNNLYSDLIKLSLKNKKIKWSKKIYKIAEIDKLQNIKSTKIKKDYLNKIIRATMIRDYYPYINIHGYKFILKK